MITPDQIIELLHHLPIGAVPEHHIVARIEAHLPKCKQRAIATIQVSMLDDDYKALCSEYQSKHNYNLHQKFRTMLEAVMKR